MAEITIDDLKLSNRARNSMARAGITMASELTEMSERELRKRVFGLGKLQVAEIQEKLAAHGLAMKANGGWSCDLPDDDEY